MSCLTMRYRLHVRSTQHSRAQGLLMLAITQLGRNRESMLPITYQGNQRNKPTHTKNRGLLSTTTLRPLGMLELRAIVKGCILL